MSEEILSDDSIEQEQQDVQQEEVVSSEPLAQDDEDSTEENVVDEPSKEPKDDASTDNKDHEALDWVKKRLAQKDRQANRRLKEKDAEVSELRAQLNAIYQPYQQEALQATQGQVLDPVTGSYVDEESVDGKVIKKLQQLKQAEVLRRQQDEVNNQLKSFTKTVDSVKNKYDDYEDVVEEAKQYLSQTMLETMVASPSSVEVVYNVWKNNPDMIKEIQKLPVHQQIKEMHRLEFVEENKIQQKLKSNAPKPISPVKQTASISNDDSFDAIVNRMKAVQKKRFGDR